MSKILLNALKKKIEGDLAVAKANVLIYKETSVGIGAHAEIVQSLETEVSKAASAQDKLKMVDILLNESQE